MNLQEQISRIKGMMGLLSEGDNQPELTIRDNGFATFKSDGAVFHFYIKKNVGIYSSVTGLHLKSPEQIAKFYYDLLVEAKKHGIDEIEEIPILDECCDSEKKEEQVNNALSFGNKLKVNYYRPRKEPEEYDDDEDDEEEEERDDTKLFRLELETLGLTNDKSIDIGRLKPSKGYSMPRYVTAYHGTLKGENDMDLNKVSEFSDIGFHVGTFKAAKERMFGGPGTNNIPLGRLHDFKTKPRFISVVVDTKNIAHMDSPISEYDIDNFVAKFKNDYHGVAYINLVEDKNSISLIIWNKDAIVSSKPLNY